MRNKKIEYGVLIKESNDVMQYAFENAYSHDFKTIKMTNDQPQTLLSDLNFLGVIAIMMNAISIVTLFALFTMKNTSFLVVHFLLYLSCIIALEEEPHPDPNDEHYTGMIYVGRHDEQTGRRIGFDDERHPSNGISYIFGTSFDESHKEMEEEDLHHAAFLASNRHGDLADRNHPTKTRQEVLREQRHKPVSERGPKPFGHVGTYPQSVKINVLLVICTCYTHLLLLLSLLDEHDLDGGVVPPKVVHVDPFFLDEAPVTNKQFGKFVKSTLYETEANILDGPLSWKAFCLLLKVMATHKKWIPKPSIGLPPPERIGDDPRDRPPLTNYENIIQWYMFLIKMQRNIVRGQESVCPENESMKRQHVVDTGDPPIALCIPGEKRTTGILRVNMPIYGEMVHFRTKMRHWMVGEARRQSSIILPISWGFTT